MWLKNDGLDLDIGGIKESSYRGYFIESKHQIVDKPDRRVTESSLPSPPPTPPRQRSCPSCYLYSVGRGGATRVKG